MEHLKGAIIKRRRKVIYGLVLPLMALIGGQLIIGTPVFAVTDASITITLGDPLAVSLYPGTFDSASSSISVTTDNYTGYVATLVNPTNSTDLIHTSDNTLYIPTITLPQGSSSITSSQFTNGYGFSTNGTNYVPAPTSSSSLALGSRNTAGTSSHTLTLGVTPIASTPSGSYSKSFNIVAIANNPQYSITFNANAGTDTATGMPSNISTTTSSTGTVTLPNSSPTRSGYTFLGWDTDSTATTPTYPSGSTNTIDLEPTQANAISLYAIWQQSGGGGGGSGTQDDPYIDDTTTNYDPTTQEPDTTVVYEAVSGQPQVTVDDSGNVTSFEFTDTTGVSIDDAAIDTGYIPFDGSKAFEIYIKAQFPPSLNNNNGSTSTALGVLLDVRNRSTNTGNNLQITYSKNATSPKALVNGADNTLGLANISGLGNYIFEATITYTPPVNNGTGNLTIVYNKNGTMTTKNISKTIDIANQTIYLGYTVNTSGNVIRQAQGTTVYEFYIKDL